MDILVVVGLSLETMNHHYHPAIHHHFFWRKFIVFDIDLINFFFETILIKNAINKEMNDDVEDDWDFFRLFYS